MSERPLDRAPKILTSWPWIAERHPQGALDLPARERIIGRRGRKDSGGDPTNTPGPPIQVGRSPGGIAITPDGKTVYVANIGSNTVTPIATATNAPGEPIEVGIGRCFRSAAWLADLRGDGRLIWFGDLGFGRWAGEPLR
jgi:YVTN family beta-propeller protein